MIRSQMWRLSAVSFLALNLFCSVQARAEDANCTAARVAAEQTLQDETVRSSAQAASWSRGIMDTFINQELTQADRDQLAKFSSLDPKAASAIQKTLFDKLENFRKGDPSLADQKNKGKGWKADGFEWTDCPNWSFTDPKSDATTREHRYAKRCTADPRKDKLPLRGVEVLWEYKDTPSGKVLWLKTCNAADGGIWVCSRRPILSTAQDVSVNFGPLSKDDLVHMRLDKTGIETFVELTPHEKTNWPIGKWPFVERDDEYIKRAQLAMGCGPDGQANGRQDAKLYDFSEFAGGCDAVCASAADNSGSTSGSANH